MITRLFLDGHPSSLKWTPIIQNMVTHFPNDYHPTFQEWSATITSMVTHYLKLIRSHKTLRNSNQTWSLTLEQPILYLLLLYCQILYNLGNYTLRNAFENMKMYCSKPKGFVSIFEGIEGFLHLHYVFYIFLSYTCYLRLSI